MRRRRCWPGSPPGPGCARAMPRWARSPACAGTCRWRSGCSPASCATTPPGRAGELAADLAAARDRLALMHAENLSVGAAFGLSYADLTPDQQRLFRRLGLVPGPSFDAYAAAALDGTALAAARRGLDELYDQHLIAEPAPAATSCTTCSASTPAPWPPKTTSPEQTKRSAGCWTTTCTPPWPPATTGPPGPPLTAARRRAAAGPRPRRVHSRAGGRLAGSRAGEPARRRRLRRRARTISSTRSPSPPR